MTAALARIDDGNGSAVAVRPTLGLLRPIAPPSEMIAAQDEVRVMIAKVLQEGRDYGNIPGVDKPSLLKPGAERVTIGFGCIERPRILSQDVDHFREVPWVKRKKQWRNQFKGDRVFEWIEEHGVALGFYRYVVEVEIVHRDSGIVVGSCIGSCSSLESKYCDRPRDSENTILKMAQKRAHVGAVLVTFGLSEQFTQDVEETADRGATGAAEPEPAPSPFDPATMALAAAREVVVNGQKLGALSDALLAKSQEWALRKLKETPDSVPLQRIARACELLMQEVDAVRGGADLRAEAAVAASGYDMEPGDDGQ